MHNYVHLHVLEEMTVWAHNHDQNVIVFNSGDFPSGYKGNIAYCPSTDCACMHIIIGFQTCVHDNTYTCHDAPWIMIQLHVFP